jgi:prophage antirepressor-like protein
MSFNNNRFFLDIFNKILKVNDNEIIIIFDNNNNLWFGLIDIVKALGYSNYRKARIKLKINNDTIKKYIEIQGAPRGAPLNILKKSHPDKKFINEFGLYELLSKSTKPLAKVFMDEYFTNIMPQIRKTGKYIIESQNKKKLDKINKELNKVKHDNKDLINNQRNIVYPIGKALYVIIKFHNDKKYYKVGYTKDLNKRLKVYNTSFPYKIFFNYYIIVNDPLIDKCIKKIFKNEEFIKNKEYYITTLNKIIKFIKSCDKSLNNMCCGYCLKCYNFNKVKLHKCKYLI